MKSTKQTMVSLLTVSLLLCVTAAAKNGNKARKLTEEKKQGRPVLWSNPEDIRSRNLFYGAGGEQDAPHTVYTFEKEDMNGTSPKFIVRDENGVRWKVKMGHEAEPETAAARLVWAVGYATNEDYFLPELHVEGMPKHLHRGQQFIYPAGTAHNVRLKRYLEGEKKVGDWRWNDNPFTGTRELDGLRVMMALISNWDLKDNNNSVYYLKHPEGSNHPEDVYMVSDLGASFGTTGLGWTQRISKGNLNSYRHSRFVSKVTPAYVDFTTPSRAAIIHIFDPYHYVYRLELRWIGRHIPRDDAHWIGQLLAQLSPQQIQDAFRAAGYSPDRVEGFAGVVEARIAALEKL